MEQVVDVDQFLAVLEDGRHNLHGGPGGFELLYRWKCGVFPFCRLLFDLRVIMTKPGFTTGYNPKQMFQMTILLHKENNCAKLL